VAEIKDTFKGVGKDLTDLKVSNATLTERVSQLPTTSKSIAMLLGALALIAALVTFQGQIQKFAGVTSGISIPAPAKNP
jgi:hypothetical protein